MQCSGLIIKVIYDIALQLCGRVPISHMFTSLFLCIENIVLRPPLKRVPDIIIITSIRNIQWQIFQNFNLIYKTSIGFHEAFNNLLFCSRQGLNWHFMSQKQYVHVRFYFIRIFI